MSSSQTIRVDPLFEDRLECSTKCFGISGVIAIPIAAIAPKAVNLNFILYLPSIDCLLSEIEVEPLELIDVRLLERCDNAREG